MNNSEAVAKDQKDRISVDISDMRTRIETCRSDPTWGELSLAGKIRSLLLERLDQVEGREDRIDALLSKLDG